MDMTFLPAENPIDEGQPTIKVVGVGGAGGNAVSHMIRKGLDGVEFIAINTDVKALKNCLAGYKVQLGSRGTGAGAKPEVGEELAKSARQAISDILNGTDMLFIAAGMGGGTGTGAAPVIAQIAKEMGILTVAVVTKPFVDEGARRMRFAENGLVDLAKNVNSLIVVHNEKLISELPEDISLIESFIAADNVLYNAVSGVSDIIHQNGYIQVDFEDVRTVMNEAGESMMGSAFAEGTDRARKAAEKAIRSPLLEGAELTNAKGALVYIAASRDSFKRSEFNAVLQEIKKYTAEEALIIGGVVFADDLAEKMKVTVLVTGLGREKANPEIISSSLRSNRLSSDIPREDAFGNRISALNNFEDNANSKTREVAAPTFTSLSLNRASTQTQAVPNVLRGRTRNNPQANETLSSPVEKDFSGLADYRSRRDNLEKAKNNSEEDVTKDLAGFIAGENTTAITNGDLSGLHIPSFMRKQAGSGGN